MYKALQSLFRCKLTWPRKSMPRAYSIGGRRSTWRWTWAAMFFYVAMRSVGNASNTLLKFSPVWWKATVSDILLYKGPRRNGRSHAPALRFNSTSHCTTSVFRSVCLSVLYFLTSFMQSGKGRWSSQTPSLGTRRRNSVSRRPLCSACGRRML